MDLSRLGKELGLSLDELLPVVESTAMLGFAKVEQDDLQLARSAAPSPRPASGAQGDRRRARAAQSDDGWIHETLQEDDNGRVAAE